jgi:plasmid stabilization system protein ParE
MKVRYKVRALRHLEQIHGYISKHDPTAARRVVMRIEHSINRLGRFPFSGRPGIVGNTRILVVPGLPYVAIYRVQEQMVDILAILHTARKRRS